MSYVKASHILPEELLRKVQEYVEGESIYIPRTTGSKKAWGTMTSTREEMKQRNRQIYEDYLAGSSSENLSQKYFLSLKSIQRIVRQEKIKRSQGF